MPTKLTSPLVALNGLSYVALEKTAADASLLRVVSYFVPYNNISMIDTRCRKVRVIELGWRT